MVLLATLYILHILNSASAKDPTGHNKPLGSHKSPRGVTLIGKFSSPSVFYEQFVKESEPLLMKSPLVDTHFPAFEKWTDDYLREKYGSEIVSVEQSKKERRGRDPKQMTLNKFLDIYKKKNVYMVHSLSDAMKNDVHLPVTLQCGGFQHVLTDVVVWMSSGGTKSVLHRDKLDNLLCVFSGTKDVLLIDKANKADVEADGFEEKGTYSKVDVDSVNLKQYPRLKNVPWHRAHLKSGDCLFIPYGWYHQINSSGGQWDRSLAVNYWFSHLWWHNSSDCKNSETFSITEPLSKFPLASTNEQIRSHILEPFRDMDDVSKEDFIAAFLASSAQTEELYHFINKDKKKALSWADLYSFNIDEAVMKFPEVFAAGVKINDHKTRKKEKLEPIRVQDDFGDEMSKLNQENVVNVPMIDPDTEEFEKVLADIVKNGEFADTIEKKDNIPDASPQIQDINVKITKGQKEFEKENTNLKKKDSKKTKKKKSSPKHDEF